MIKQIYCVRDSKTGSYDYANLMSVTALKDVVDAIIELMKEDTSVPWSDLTLYHLGSWNTNTAVTTFCEPEMVCKCIDLHNLGDQ